MTYVELVRSFNPETITVYGASQQFEKNLESIYEILEDEDTEDGAVKYTIRQRPDSVECIDYSDAKNRMDCILRKHPEYSAAVDMDEDGAEYITGIVCGHAPGRVRCYFIRTVRSLDDGTKIIY